MRNILERSLPPIGGVSQLHIGYRYSGRQDEPESGFLMLRSGIGATGNYVFPIILEPVYRPALSRQPLSGRPTKNTGTSIVCLLRPGRRRSRVSRQRSTEPRQRRIEPC